MHHRYHFHTRGDDRRRGRGPATDLHLELLALLAGKPRYGYEVIQEMAESSHGFFKPSPDMVYPALTYLEEIGYATATAEGARRRYEITEAGREHLKEPLGGRRGRQESQELWLARRGLKSALRAQKTASAEEQQRIVGILNRATAEILGTTAH